MSEVAIKAFLETDYTRLVGALSLVTGSRALAEDAVNEAMARAWERMDRGATIDSVPAWITTVAMNLSRSGLRRLRTELLAKDRLKAGQDSSSVEPNADRIEVRRALAELPRRQREATILRFYLDMDVAEVARAMGVSEGTAKSTLARARTKLSKTLGEQEEARLRV